MKIKNISLFVIAFFAFTSIIAQQGRGNGPRFDMAEYKIKQAEHLKQELKLTDAEAKAFIPLVNEFTEKKFELNRTERRESRELRDKPNATDAEYTKALNNYLELRNKELELEKEYYQKFKAVLPISKVYKYQRIESKFMEEAVAKFRERRRSAQK